MFRLYKIILICCFLYLPTELNAQNLFPAWFINTDLANDIELIPTFGIEKFYVKHNQHRSWHIDVGYQISYSNQFGFIFNQGDIISLGVYQGPATKIGYSYFTKWHNRKWKNYLSPALGIKYLWYSPIKVWTDPVWLNPAYRIQSEKCISLVPQFYIGQKRIWDNFCYDYYFGLQLPIKFRDKTIFHEEDNYGVANPNVPYKSFQVIAGPNLVFGIKIGYIKNTTPPEREDNQPENDTEDTKNEKE